MNGLLKKRCVCLLMLLCLFSGISAGARITRVFAESNARVYANDVSATQGGYAYAYIKAENFNAIGSFELFVYYDDSVFSVHSQRVEGLLNGETVSTNVSAPGEAELFAASATGISGNGNLWYITFKVSESAKVGDYPVTIAVGEANSTDFQPTSVLSSNFYIRVKQKTVSAKSTTFTATTPSSIKQGETATISYYVSGNTNNFASADFEINYDEQVLSLRSVEVGSALSALDGAMTSVNDTVRGYVKISFAALVGVSNYVYSNSPLFKLSFTALKNEAEATNVVMTASSLYGSSFASIGGNTVTKSVTVLYTAPVIVLPQIKIADYKGSDKAFVTQIVADAETLLAAGDFVVKYDSEKLSCAAVQKTIAEATLVANIKKDSNEKEIGEIKFSFLKSGGITVDSVLAKLSFQPLSVGNTNLTLSGTGITDGNYKAVSVDLFGAEIELSHDVLPHSGQAATCDDEGWEDYVTCENCSYTTYKEIPAKGHAPVQHSGQAATCDDNGWEDYVTCENCSYTTYKEIPAKGHAPVQHSGQAATCDDEGWEDYVTCENCSYTTYKEIPAKGHAPVQHSGQAATCDDEGWEDYVTCENCSYTTYKEIPAKGHAPVQHSGQAATCDDEGWEDYVTCENCSYTTYKEIPAKGHDEVLDKAVLPTCTETGKTEGKHCSRCSEVFVAQVEIPAKGHNYSTEWTIDNEPSCTENGYKSYHCNDCDDKKEVTEIPAIGHDYGEWICDKVATAWNTGHEYRECSNCKEKEERIIEKVQGSGCNNSLGGNELSALLCVVLAIKKWIA